MANMTDTAQIATIFNWMLNGAAIGTQPTMPPYLRLMSAMGTAPANKNGSNGTEMTSTNLPGYTAGGKQLAASGAGFGTFSATTDAAVSNSNAVSWSITGSQTANVVGVEVWDNAATKVRLLQGTLTSAISGAANGDTIQFAAASITVDPTAW